MPNHITSRLQVEGKPEDVKRLFDFIKSDAKDEDGDSILIDFNKILPMPAELDVESSSEGADGKKYLLGHSGNILEREAYKKSEHCMKMEAMKEENPKRFEKCMQLGKSSISATLPSMAKLTGTVGDSLTGEQSGTPTTSARKLRTSSFSIQHGRVCQTS